MNGRGVTALVRGWVDLYTRGLPAALRAARRDEVDDDLWCQHEEADALGRSPRSLAGEILLRLFLGMAADLSWRVSHREKTVHVDTERSPSMAARVIGALAVIGGASWGTMIFFTAISDPTDWTVTTPSADTFLILAGGLGLTGGIIGPAWLYQDEVRSQAGLAAASGGLATVLVALGGYEAFLVVPIASAIVVWEMAHIGVLSRALAVVHALSGAAFVAVVVSSQIDYVGTLSNHLLVALGVPYMLTWIVIGAAFLHGVRAAHEPVRGG